jgi:hypothetical protein
MDEMRLAKIREQLHDFIDSADETALTLIFAIMQGDDNYTLTDEQQKLLQLTIDQHEGGNSKSFSWAEARSIIEKPLPPDANLISS